MKTVLLDCDGVILDFPGTIHRAAQKALGRRLAAPESWTDYDFRKSMGLSKSEGEYFTKYLRRKDRIGYQIPFYPSAQSFVEHLGFQNKVVFVTTPWRGLDHWVEARYSVLDHFLGRRNYSIVLTHDKHLIEGEWHIDDKWEHLAERPERGILFARPYNATTQPQAHYVAGNYTDVLAILEKPVDVGPAIQHAVVHVPAKSNRKTAAAKRKR